MRVAIIAITRGGAVLGNKIGDGIDGAELYVSSRYADQADQQATTFEAAELRGLIASLWKRYDGFILVMATGIVIRMIAPLLESKATDPAVVVMDDAGRYAISLLSGHLGGANELAGRCAAVTGAEAVVTTATDANQLPSFDMLAKEQGWGIADISRVKRLNTLLLDNKEIAVVDSTGLTRSWLNGRCNISFHDNLTAAQESLAAGFLFVSNRLLSSDACPENLLILRPRNLVLGIGCNRGTPADEIAGFVSIQLEQLSRVIESVACIATAVAKRDETGLLEYAASLGVPLVCFESEELNLVKVPSPPSAHALAAIGAVGVAEPAAILAAHGGKLLLGKVKSANVTLAVTEMEPSACTQSR
ncbi:MAG TPA: cobalt-precorrin 5A hydrolase [Desulfuromonadales bacterium]|nr:cobalt-precorrin 5A hydrolase [Desulfuromonadales bacterium]